MTRAHRSYNKLFESEWKDFSKELPSRKEADSRRDTAYIYGLCLVGEDVPFYVGETRNPRARASFYADCIRFDKIDPATSTKFMQAEAAKHGHFNFRMIELEKCGYDERRKREAWWINELTRHGVVLVNKARHHR